MQPEQMTKIARGCHRMFRKPNLDKSLDWVIGGFLAPRQLELAKELGAETYTITFNHKNARFIQVIERMKKPLQKKLTNFMSKSADLAPMFTVSQTPVIVNNVEQWEYTCDLR